MYTLQILFQEILGPTAYKMGEPITSDHQTTMDIACKSGTYYIRALVVDPKEDLVAIQKEL